jgi:probable rRNA maturation factor
LIDVRKREIPRFARNDKMLNFSVACLLGARGIIVQISMIVNRQRRVPVAINPLRQFYERVRLELGFASETVTIQLVSDETMARLNETFRKTPGPTDVLSFPANGVRPARDAEYIGDIAISPETARRNARRFSRSLPMEMRILILHGMIHLAGFDHETDHGEMDRLERRLRKKMGVAGR